MADTGQVSRRTFIGGVTGAATAAALGSWPTAGLAADHERGHGGHGRLVPRNRLGLQQWAIRDAITRANGSVSGYLGGPDFPQDARDLGPLTPLPGGFAAVFDHLASVGYRGIEFFSFDQGANSPATPSDLQIRAWLDAAGLRAAGSHTGGLQQMIDPVYRQQQIERARVLGYRMIGTAGNPANPTLGTLAAWQGYGEQANTVGAALRAVGITYFFHPEQDWFRFFEDPAHPELDRVHRIDWFTDNTDHRYVSFEPDTMHTLAGRARFPDPVDGTLFDVNRWYSRLSRQRRLIAWHLKDADRIPLPDPDTNPYAQLHWRPGFPLALNAGVDAVYAGEGDIARGYPDDVDPEVLGYAKALERYPLSDPGWFHTESDNAPDTPPAPAQPQDPGRSLRWAKISARNMLSLRAEHGRRRG